MWDTALDATWDTTETSNVVHLSHDMECTRCHHAAHTFLACSDTCACVPPPVPGVYPAELLVSA
jgi:hypothetical protein